MLWLILSLAAAILIATVSIVDKHIISDEVKDPWLCTAVFGIMLLFLYPIFSLLTGNPLSSKAKLIAITTGAIYIIAVYLYYVAYQKEEASRVAPAIATETLFTAMLAYLFLSETLTNLKYVGIGCVVLGLILVSTKVFKKSFRISKIIIAALAAAFLFATRNILVKYLSAQESLYSFLAWVGVGAGLVAIVILAVHHPHLKKKMKKGIRRLILNNLISFVALILMYVALTLQKASLVTAITSLYLVFVFVGATLLTKFHPKFIHEKLDKKNLALKVFGIVLSFAGAVLVTGVFG